MSDRHPHRRFRQQPTDNRAEHAGLLRMQPVRRQCLQLGYQVEVKRGF